MRGVLGSYVLGSGVKGASIVDVGVQAGVQSRHEHGPGRRRGMARGERLIRLGGEANTARAWCMRHCMTWA